MAYHMKGTSTSRVAEKKGTIVSGRDGQGSDNGKVKRISAATACRNYNTVKVIIRAPGENLGHAGTCRKQVLVGTKGGKGGERRNDKKNKPAGVRRRTFGSKQDIIYDNTEDILQDGTHRT